jgi:site-specific recombinase XerD
MKTYPLPVYVQRFFTERLITQLAASPNTVASYRDTFRLLLKYASDQLGREPACLQVADIDADLVGGFLNFVEITRANVARSRNTRLSAIRSFFKYVAFQEPQLLHHCQRILAMPAKRHEKRAVSYLNRVEIEALIAAPDPATWCGRRDRTLLPSCGADGASGLGTHPLELWRCGARNGCARPLHGQGAKGPLHATEERQHGRTPHMVGAPNE